jgi:hypothetical protein
MSCGWRIGTAVKADDFSGLSAGRYNGERV